MRSIYVILLTVLLAAVVSERADGYLPFHKEWVRMYIDQDDESDENQEYIKLVAKGKYRCLVCHQGKKRTNHNPYGQYFVGEIGKEDQKDPDKIIAILTAVGKMPVDPEADPDDENTITFNDLIAKKQFPGGELEELEQEPAEEDEGEE